MRLRIAFALANTRKRICAYVTHALANTRKRICACESNAEAYALANACKRMRAYGIACECMQVHTLAYAQWTRGNGPISKTRIGITDLILRTPTSIFFPSKRIKIFPRPRVLQKVRIRITNNFHRPRNLVYSSTQNK